MNTLDEIFQKYGTDKNCNAHNYTPFYEEVISHLRDNPINLLEIGVREGWSHLSWSDYFSKGKIFGVDNCLVPDSDNNHKKLTERGIVIFYGNQEDKDFLNTAVSENTYDVIIDDGGHRMIEQQHSLKYLISSVRSGGFYFIEDLHTCSIPHCYPPGNYPEDSTINLLNALNDLDVYSNMFISQEEFTFIKSKIKNVRFLKDNLAVIYVK